jgi:aspartyl-tRNA(Asn)/glutamyl-tRNA(Gln) amidotransferase subunit A
MIDRTLTAAAEALAAGEVTAVGLTEACLARIDALDPGLNSFVHLARETALAAAAASDARRARGETLGPLDGVPVAVKDIFCTEGLPTTAASRILEGYVPPYDATAVARLKAAGAVILGKLNMDEFAMGSANVHSAFGPCKNPWDPARTPGGSSGGSAAAVAARLCFGTLGTDTGGSIRQPAALTGTVGLKPTYGRVSRYGVIAFASSLDQVGPFGRTVADVAALLGIVAGHDVADSTSVDRPVPDYRAALTGRVDGLTLGVPREYLQGGIEPEVEAAVRAAIAWYADAGAEIVEVSLPHTDYGIACYYLIAPAEASSNLARYDGIRYGRRVSAETLAETYTRTRTEGFGDEVKRRLMLGTYALSAGYYDAYYLKAQKVRALVKQDFDAAFETVDALLTPTSPTVAWPLESRKGDPLAMYLADVFTVGANLAGLPGLSLPCGFSSEGLPIGLQILGRPFDESTILRLGHAYEQAHDWHARAPEAAR